MEYDMAIIRPLNGIAPKIGKGCFIAENAAIIGDVEIGDDCSIWYGAVLRGDVNPIRESHPSGQPREYPGRGGAAYPV